MNSEHNSPHVPEHWDEQGRPYGLRMYFSRPTTEVPVGYCFLVTHDGDNRFVIHEVADTTVIKRPYGPMSPYIAGRVSIKDDGEPLFTDHPFNRQRRGES